MSERTQLAGRLRAMAEDIYGHPCHVDLLAAAEAIEAREWKPLAGLPDTAVVIYVGGWIKGEWVTDKYWNAGSARRLGFTHYFTPPAPPDVTR